MGSAEIWAIGGAVLLGCIGVGCVIISLKVASKDAGTTFYGSVASLSSAGAKLACWALSGPISASSNPGDDQSQPTG